MAKKPRHDRYERLEVKAERGEFSLVVPLDYLILGQLHDEGAMFAGVYPDAHTAERLVTDLGLQGKLTALQIGSRMLGLRKQKLVVQVKVPGTHGAISYQRTARGKTVWQEWKKEQSDGDQ